MGKRAFLSEYATAQILRRYSPAAVIGVLREVAKCDKARPDWNIIAKKFNEDIRSARECKALWRHIAYRKELADSYPEDEQPSDDDSDLDFELLPSPAVNSEDNSEVVRWVKADMQLFNISAGAKKKGETKGKSKSRAARLPAELNERSSGRGACNGTNGDSSMASPPGVACQSSLANFECKPSKEALGQSERKKRKLWSPEEDQELFSCVEKFGEGNWTHILKESFTHKRTAAQLSQRWALLTRKSKGPQVVANRPDSPPSAEQSNDQSAEASPAQNGGNSAKESPVVPTASIVGNGSMEDLVAPIIATASSSQGQDHVDSTSDATLKTRVNGAINGSVATLGSIESVAINGAAGTPIRSETHDGQRQTCISASGGGIVSRSTAGSSTSVAVTPSGQARCSGAKTLSANGSKTVGANGAKTVGANGAAGRLIAPGAVVMSAAAAQAASVGVGALPTTTLTTGSTKYVGRNNSGGTGGRCLSSKGLTGPDPGVQAAAVAAGARIAPAASLLKAAHSANVVHIRQGGIPATKTGLSSQVGTGHDLNGGMRGSSGGIVHYITTGGGGPPTLLPGKRPAQQTKSQAVKLTGASQMSNGAINGPTSPSPSNPAPQVK